MSFRLAMGLLNAGFSKYASEDSSECSLTIVVDTVVGLFRKDSHSFYGLVELVR